MKIKFWGTRGSIAVAEPEMMKYGGNTSCVEVRLNSGELLIFDAGTGIRRLGLSLLQDPDFKQEGHILISHCHWDHIQGLPFFAPAFHPQYSWTIYGQLKLDGRLEDLLRWQMEHLYFPVKLEQMGATIRFVELIEEDITIGEAKITARHLNHPQGNMGFRVESPEGIFVYCTDTEHYKEHIDSKILELAQSADILVYDGQYTPEEYSSHVGWGHSTWEAGVEVARKSGVKKLVLFHHDPGHDDATIDNIVSRAQKIFPGTIAAQRDMELLITKTLDQQLLQTIKSRIQCKNDTIYIKLRKDIHRLQNKEFTVAFEEVVQKSVMVCVLDIKGLSAIDSASLRALAQFYQICSKQGIKLKIVHATKNIREALEISRFTGVIEVE